MTEQTTLINECDKSLLKIALTHPSYTLENNLSYTESYERLEFLGDSVLKLHVSRMLFEKFPEYKEGKLSKIRSILVSDNTLAQIAKQINLGELLLLGKGEVQSGGNKRDSILACSLEAIFGACYLSNKENLVSDFINTYFSPLIQDIDEHFVKYNAKEALQEYTQSISKEPPTYKIVTTKGPVHNLTFTAEVYYRGEKLAQGDGKTKKEAEQNAAYNACCTLGILN